MKKILLPTDFSENSFNAVKYAIHIFSDETCHFTLLNTYEMPHGSAGMLISLMDVMEKNAKEDLQTFMHSINELQLPKQHTFETKAAFGPFLDVVQNTVEFQSIDFIIMGTKGASGISEMLMGSNTFSVIQKVTCPVICVPENATLHKPKNIVFATDYGNIENPEVLNPLKEIAQVSKSEIFIVNVKDKNAPLVEAGQTQEGLSLHNYLEEIPHHFDHWNIEKIEDGIQEYAQDVNANLICMLKRERTFLEQLFNKSVTKKMAFHTDIPLLVIHERNK